MGKKTILTLCIKSETKYINREPLRLWYNIKKQINKAIVAKN